LRKLLLFILPVAGLLALTLGCSKSKTVLDRDTAGHEISSRFEGEDSELLVEVGKVGLHCADENRDGTKMELPIDPQHQVSHIVAQKAGYISVTREGNGFWTVALTDKGKAALQNQPKDDLPDYTKKDDRNTLNGCDFRQVAFKIARPALVRVMGVTVDERAPKADFLYKWQTTELGDVLRADGSVFAKLDPLQQAELVTAEFALIYRVPVPVPPADETESGTVTFEHYDDGWRIK
jgi:hypothetical protein